MSRFIITLFSMNSNFYGFGFLHEKPKCELFADMLRLGLDDIVKISLRLWLMMGLVPGIRVSFRISA